MQDAARAMASALLAEECKFAHLLQPIKDMAANWDINIASELEEYLVRRAAATLRLGTHVRAVASRGRRVLWADARVHRTSWSTSRSALKAAPR